jgi:hypothetical protein
VRDSHVVILACFAVAAILGFALLIKMSVAGP